jgi:hypothetical protein
MGTRGGGPPGGGDRAQRRRRTAVGFLLLAAAVGIPLSGVVGNGFLSWDDGAYLTGNPQVREGLTLGGLRWAFVTGHASNWHPLTWLSHQAEVSLLGLNPGRHHAVSLALHLASCLILGGAVLGMTGSRFTALTAVLLFGVHPLRVESVAWASERKDTLALLFLALSLAHYLRHARRPSPGSLLRQTVLLALGLMAKPSLVVLPLLLLLLDHWPLGRWRGVRGAGGGWSPGSLLLEKVPLLLLSGVSSAVTLAVQGHDRTATALGSLLPLGRRAANALVSTLRYLGDTVAPAGLSPFHPYPDPPRPYHLLTAAAILTLATIAVVVRVRKSPWLITGWLWYLAALLPVAGLVQVGLQGRADRYTLIPHLGITLLLAAVLRRMAGSRRKVLGGAVTAVLGLALAMGGITARQVGYWRDDVSLFTRALEAGGDGFLVRNNLGLALAGEGRLDEAVVHYRRALELYPAAINAWNNLGVALGQSGRLQEAEAVLRRAVLLKPDYREAWDNLGIVLEAAGRRDEAREAFRLGSGRMISPP